MSTTILPKNITFSHTFDRITAKQRLKIPLGYRWLKFKTAFLGLTLKRGIAL